MKAKIEKTIKVAEELKGVLKPLKKKKKESLKMGRKSKYYTHVEPKLELIKAWCRNGAIEDQIIKKLGVSIQSFYTYKREHLELFEALKMGKEDVDDMVVNALLKRALGYSYKEVTKEYETYDGKMALKNERVVTKEVIPDTTAQIYWTKNRMPDKWRNSDRIELGISEVSKESNDVLSSLSYAVRDLIKNKQTKEDMEPLNEKIVSQDSGSE